MANLENAAGRVLTTVERNRLTMTLQSEGVQLLGEKASTGKSSTVPHAAVEHASCTHDSNSTQ
eukprot:1129536-Amphidinium_carterae.1